MKFQFCLQVFQQAKLKGQHTTKLSSHHKGGSQLPCLKEKQCLLWHKF